MTHKPVVRVNPAKKSKWNEYLIRRIREDKLKIIYKFIFYLTPRYNL